MKNMMLMLMLFLVFSVVAFAKSNKGEKLYKKYNCHTCHGSNGDKTLLPTYPKIAGQNKAYLVAQLKLIRDGKRKSGIASVMKASISGITNKEIKAVAKYVSSLDPCSTKNPKKLEKK